MMTMIIKTRHAGHTVRAQRDQIGGTWRIGFPWGPEFRAGSEVMIRAYIRDSLRAKAEPAARQGDNHDHKS